MHAAAPAGDLSIVPCLPLPPPLVAVPSGPPGPLSQAAATTITAPGGGAPKLWKKKNAEQRVQRTYKTAEQVLQESQSRPLASQPILDLRGPQARLITNMEHLQMDREAEVGGWLTGTGGGGGGKGDTGGWPGWLQSGAQIYPLGCLTLQ